VWRGTSIREQASEPTVVIHSVTMEASNGSRHTSLAAWHSNPDYHFAPSLLALSHTTNIVWAAQG
ncbi:MAG TPA: hypothetical protein VHT68_20910, partial [Pseudolabrys sp.]|nr:hypothetical protein [Pseudolabrys sp.]